MASLQHLTNLAEGILRNTNVLTAYLEREGKEAPTFDAEGLSEWDIGEGEVEVRRARPELVDMSRELGDLAVGPREGLKGLAWDCIDNLSLQVVCEFKIAEAVPIEGTISYQELAEKVGVPLLKLRPLIRHAITNHIFHEPLKNHVAHTSTSRLLLPNENPPMHAWVNFWTDDLAISVANVVNAMKKWPDSQESNETSVNYAWDTKLNWYDWVQQKEGLAKRYGLAMAAHGGGEGFRVEYTVEGYPWGGWKEGATVVDMGGSQGFVSFAIAEKFPALNFIVQDTAGMRTPETIGTVPEALRDRVKLTTHDFFTEQTVVADVYFFRWIFHGFSEKYCVEILRKLTPALRKGARVVINDGVLPEPGSVGRVEEKSMRTMDVVMQVTVNARERELDDWAELFKTADPRYKFLNAWKPEKSRMWMIEAEWTG